MSVASILQGTPAALGGVNARSFNNQDVTGVKSLSGGDAGGLAISSAAGTVGVTIAGANVAVATIPNGAATIAVANTNVTANSLVFVTPLAANAAIAAGQGPLRVVLNAGVGFNITSTANADGAGLRVAYWVAKY